MTVKKSLLSCFVLLLTSSHAFAKAERWFDIEVILFQPLNNKAQINESFEQSKPLPNYQKVHDLLTPYLTPDISIVKNLLPVCGLETHSTLGHITSGLESPIAQTSFLFEDTDVLATANNFIANEEIQPLLLQAASTFTEKSNIHGSIRPERFDSSIQSNFPNEKLCRLSQDTLAALKQNDPTFKQYTYNITHVPRQIDAVENLFNDKLYLLSQESLALHDIYKKLRNSRTFKPLLHVGWRQPAVAKRKSVPVRLYAGENYQQYYQTMLIDYANQQHAENEQEQLLQEIMGGEQASDANAFDKQSVKQMLKHLVSIEENQENINALLTPLDEIMDNEPTINAEPEAPAQNWTIDGYFNVHLNHYLYITADFVVADQSLASLSSQQLISQKNQPIKSIRFEQNRRVISKEIHYFDHPHMGIIVQIRRHKRPELL